MHSHAPRIFFKEFAKRSAVGGGGAGAGAGGASGDGGAIGNGGGGKSTCHYMYLSPSTMRVLMD